MSSNKQPTPGDTFHFLRSGFVFPASTRSLASEVSRRGMQVTITSSLVEANTSRYGECWLSLLYDEAAQIDKWGEVRFRLGPAPEDLTPWHPDSAAELDIQREHMRHEASTIADDGERKREYDRIAKLVGRTPTSKTLNHLGGAR